MFENNEKKVNVAIYCRVSTEEQAKEGFSIKAQTEKLKDYSRIRDWNVYDIYSDPGISGKNITERPDVNRMIKDIIQGSVNTVLVYKVDRLTRNTRDLIELVDIFNKNDCDFISLSESIDTQTASGRMFLKIIGIFAEFERENIVERTKFGIARKVKEGFALCRTNTSYGYKCETGKDIQVINEEESKIVKWIFNKFLNENISISKICDELNLKKIKTRKGNVWNTSYLCRLLRNVNYIGLVRHHIESDDYAEYQGKHEAIIDLDTFNLVQKKLEKRQIKTKTKRPKDENFFVGTVYCSICGSRMTTQGRYERRKDGSKKYIGNYRCPNKELKQCQAKDLSHSKLEEAFVKHIENIKNLKKPKTIDIEQNSKLDEINELYSQYQEQLSKFEKREKEIMSLYINGDLNFDEYTKMCQIVKKEIYNINNELENLKSEQEIEENEITISKEDIITNVKENWNYLTNNEKAEFVSSFIKTISVCNQKQANTHYGKIKIEKIDFFSN